MLCSWDQRRGNQRTLTKNHEKNQTNKQKTAQARAMATKLVQNAHDSGNSTC